MSQLDDASISERLEVVVAVAYRDVAELIGERGRATAAVSG
jgi:hypothetical protein